MDRACYTIARSHLESGNLVPEVVVRVGTRLELIQHVWGDGLSIALPGGWSTGWISRGARLDGRRHVQILVAMRHTEEELREQQELLEKALERQVHRDLEFQWTLDPIGRLHGLARFSGNENASFWILPSGGTVVIH